MTNRTVLAAAALCTTAVVTLTACGDDKKADAKEAGTPASATPSPAKPFEGLTPAQISEKSRLAMTKLKSFKVKGSMTIQGKEMAFDVAVGEKGNCLGTFTREGVAADLRWVGDYTYMRGDEKFWQQTAKEEGASSEETTALTELLKGRWVKSPAGSANTDGEFPFCDTATIFTKDKKESRLTRGAETEVHGTHAVTLTGKDGAATQTLVVSAEGEPYALRMTEEGGKEPGTLEFSAFNEPVTVTPPPADQVIDLDKLKG
ncbi:hypothetical protein ACWCQN_46095 [Streptomyces sp. NPDC001984]|uniref:hypothetical protein n=1 Tax=Streptomyces sp. NPDC002619 TaxID=3364655 RepID=UPI00367C54D6